MLFVKPLSHCRNCFWFDYGITVPNHVLIKQMWWFKCQCFGERTCLYGSMQLTDEMDTGVTWYVIMPQSGHDLSHNYPSSWFGDFSESWAIYVNIGAPGWDIPMACSQKMFTVNSITHVCNVLLRTVTDNYFHDIASYYKGYTSHARERIAHLRTQQRGQSYIISYHISNHSKLH